MRVLQTAVALACLLACFLAAAVMHVQAGVAKEVTATATVNHPDNLAVHITVTRSGYPVWFGLRPEEFDELAATLAGEAKVAGFTGWAEAIPIAGPGGWLYYIGVTPEYFGIMGLRLADGRLPLGAGECVLGAMIEELAPTDSFGRHAHPILSSSLAVVGHLQPTAGPVVPTPPGDTIWSKRSVDVFVFAWRDNPCTKSVLGQPLTPTGLNVLIEPSGDHPGLVLDRAIEMIESWYPEARICVAVGSTLQITLSHLSGQLESHYHYLMAGFIIIVCLMVAGLSLYDVARTWRSMSVRRCLGATRFDIWVRQAWPSLAAATVGAALGVAAAALLGPDLTRAVGLPWGESRTWFIPPLIIGVVALTSLCASLRATAVPPRAGWGGPMVLRKARRIDLRKILAGCTLATAVASLLVVTACGRAGMAHIESVLASSGERTVVVRAALGDDTASARLMALLATGLPSSYAVSRYSLVHVPVGTGEREMEAPVYAVEGPFLAVRGWNVSPPEDRRGSFGTHTCHLGYRLAEDLFHGEDPMGRSLIIAGRSFVVAGIVRERPSEMIDLVSDRDRSVIVPLDLVSDLPHFRTRSLPPEIWVLLPGSVSMEDGLGRVSAELAAFGDVEVESLLDGVHAMEAVRRAGSAFLTGVSVCGLLVGGLAVSACFLALSGERRRSTAIRRVVGARRGDILQATVREVTALCLASSIPGMALGMCLGYVLCRFEGWPARVYWDLALLGLVAAALVVPPTVTTLWAAERGSLCEQLRIEE